MPYWHTVPPAPAAPPSESGNTVLAAVRDNARATGDRDDHVRAVTDAQWALVTAYAEWVRALATAQRPFPGERRGHLSYAEISKLCGFVRSEAQTRVRYGRDLLAHDQIQETTP